MSDDLAVQLVEHCAADGHRLCISTGAQVRCLCGKRRERIGPPSSVAYSRWPNRPYVHEESE